MSEEENTLEPVRPDEIKEANPDISLDEGAEIQDFDQNGLLLKIATDGISVQDYVKRLKVVARYEFIGRRSCITYAL